MRYFINVNIARHFTHALFKNSIHLWILLPVYISSLNLHYLNSIIMQNTYIELIHITLTTH